MRSATAVLVVLGLVTVTGCNGAKWQAFDEWASPQASVELTESPAPAASSPDALAKLVGEAPPPMPEEAEPEPPRPMERPRVADLGSELRLEMKSLLGNAGEYDAGEEPGGVYEEPSAPPPAVDHGWSTPPGAGDGVPGRIAILQQLPADSRQAARATKATGKPGGTGAARPMTDTVSGPTLGGTPLGAATSGDLDTALRAAGCKIVSRTGGGDGPLQRMVKLDGELYAITFVPAGAARPLPARELDKLEQGGAVRRSDGMILAVTHADRTKASALLAKLVNG
jgi:hypothetical protein